MAHQNKKGFTLVELIIVVSIIAVLASLAFMALSGETAQARDSKRLADIKVFEDAIATSNGKNKKIDYNNSTDNGSVPDDYSTVTSYQVTTSAGTLTPMRGAYLVPVKSGIFDSDVIPTIPRDPKGAPYYGAFLSATDYQIFGSAENPDTKVATAIVRGSFKEGAILDVLTNDIAVGDGTIPVASARRFVKGDIVKVDSEEMLVVSFNTTTNIVTVTRAQNGTTAAVHNKGASVKLKTAATGADSLVCLGTIQDADGGAIANAANYQAAVTGAAAIGAVCDNSTISASAGSLTDGGITLPYNVGAE